MFAGVSLMRRIQRRSLPGHKGRVNGTRDFKRSRVFSHTDRKTKTNQNEPAASASKVYSPAISWHVILLSRRVVDLCGRTSRGNKVLIHCYWPCPSVRRPLQNFARPGCRQKARGGCNSTVNRWHTPFLSLLFPQSLHPGATGSPKSAPIMTPVSEAEEKVGGGACTESNGSNPTLMRQQQTKPRSLKN